VSKSPRRFKSESQLKESGSFDFELSPGVRLVIALNRAEDSPFQCLTWARGVADSVKSLNSENLGLVLTDSSKESALDALVSALAATAFAFEKTTTVKSDDKNADYRPQLTIIDLRTETKKGSAPVKRQVKSTLRVAEATNLVRRLTMMPTNQLTNQKYKKIATDLAKGRSLACKFHGRDQLRKYGAGAFLAVGQASQGEGILEISYRPKTGAKSAGIALVGKGITFDTGGVNVKPGAYMHGMHGDMNGSAVALALILCMADLEWPQPVTAYLAICDNLIGDKAYKPNDVVTAMDGTTIEVIHTDAEGRMVLADTLAFASRKKPSFILDFATLTGSCVSALGTNYSGGFTNDEGLIQKIIASGRLSGERVWPFPIDDDYGECLESDVADIKQCRLKGGADHIEAAYFLKRFVGDDIPWVHVDLAACEHEGGLAHVPTSVTGFGVRFGLELLKSITPI
jgi:leucyl aminopeptidase